MRNSEFHVEAVSIVFKPGYNSFEKGQHETFAVKICFNRLMQKYTNLIDVTTSVMFHREVFLEESRTANIQLVPLLI